MFKEIKVLRSHGRQFIGNLRRQNVSELFRGRPVISEKIKPDEIQLATGFCPAGAISDDGSIDMGKCVFCRECSFLLPGIITFTNDYRIASNEREALIIKPGCDVPVRVAPGKVRKEVRDLFSGALKLRQVSAGGDNSSEMELNAAGNVNFDMGRFGIEFVASPRHADGVVITGPVSENMAEALRMTYEAIPEPRIIILAGTDAISGGIFVGSDALSRDFINNKVIDLYVPGNPVHPLTFINGILDLLGKK